MLSSNPKDVVRFLLMLYLYNKYIFVFRIYTVFALLCYLFSIGALSAPGESYNMRPLSVPNKQLVLYTYC